jgi:hypothetical protein
MLQIFQATTAGANIRLGEMNIATDWANLVLFGTYSKGHRTAGAEQPVPSDQDSRKVKRAKDDKKKDNKSTSKPRVFPIRRTKEETNQYQYHSYESRD